MSFITELYHNMVEERTASDGLQSDREEIELGDKFDKLLKENNITGDKYTALWNVMCDLISHCKCEGFKNGFKMGEECMIEVTCGK